MLTKIHELIDNLSTSGLRYCHWKSNVSLEDSLSGQTDVDLLIHRDDRNLFRTILSQLCFWPAINKDGGFLPSMEHYFALDEQSGVLIHIHAYFRVITGESLAKNYRLPIEQMLLQNTRELDGVRVPTKSAELVVFTLRMLLKHTSPVELVLLARNWKQAQQEINWLMETDSIDESLSIVNDWLPSLDPGLFSGCVAALMSPAPLLRRVILGRRLRSRLRLYSRYSVIRAQLSGIKKFTVMLYRRLTQYQRGMFPQSGGAVIAIVGPEATGKSTLLTEINRWLGEYFVVEQIHAGKPKSTIFTVIPNLLLPALRHLLPTYRSSHIETKYVSREQTKKSQKVYPIIFAIRSVLLAYDRRSLLTRAFRRAGNGTIVLCDRYPSQNSGVPDSPQLMHLPLPPDQYPIRRRLATIENRLYRKIPPPDIIISLSVPVEVAILRNETRGKKEPEDYVRMRHTQGSNLNISKTPVYKINTDQPLDKTVLEVKKAIWPVL